MSVLDVKATNNKLREEIRQLIISHSNLQKASQSPLPSKLYASASRQATEPVDMTEYIQPRNKHIDDRIPDLLPRLNREFTPHRANSRSAGQQATTNFFDEFRDKVNEIRNTPYSPPKLQRNEAIRTQLLPAKRTENLLFLKIERQNLRIEDLEATVRQLKLQNQHLEIFNDALKAREAASQEQRILEERNLQDDRKDLVTRAQEVLRQKDWILDEQRKTEIREKELSKREKDLVRRETQLHLKELDEKAGSQAKAKETDRTEPRKRDMEKIFHLECENLVLRKEVHELNKRSTSSTGLARESELRDRLEASMRIISFYTSREQNVKEWYEEESTEQLLFGDSTTMQLLRQPRSKLATARKGLRAYFMAVIFIVRVRKQAASYLDQAPWL